MTIEQLHKKKNQILIREYIDVSIKAHEKDGDYDDYMKIYSDEIITIEDEEQFRKILSEEIDKKRKLINSQS